MIDQINYLKYLNTYDMLYNHHIDREEATAKMFGRVLGKQLWDDKDIALLTSQRRPAHTYNFLLPLALHLAGSQIQTRSSMKAVPFKDATVEGANAITNLMFWNFDKSYFEFEFTRNFIMTIIASLGWMINYWSFTKGHWICKSVDPFRIRWDIGTKERGFTDCRFLQDTTWATAEELMAIPSDEATRDEVIYRLSTYEPRINKHAWYEKIYNSTFDWSPTSVSRRDDFVDMRMGRYRAINHHEKRDIPVAVLVDPETRKYEVVTDFPKEKVDALFRENPRFEMQRFNLTQNWSAIVCPAIQMVINEERYEVETPDNDFIFHPTFCYDLHPDIKESIGVFDNLYEIVQSINKRKATMLEYIMTATSGDWIASAEAIQGFEEDWNTPGFKYVRRFNQGATPPMRDRPPALPEGVWRYEREELEFLELISGLTKNMRGFRENPQESGTLFRSKVQQAEVQLAYMMNNMTYSQKKLAISCVHHIQAFMTDEEQKYLTDYNTGQEIFMDVNKKEGEEIRNDVVNGTYNIAIDTTKPSISARQLAFLESVELARVGMPPELMRWDLVVKNSDIPNSAEWSAYIKMILKLKFGIDVDNMANTDQQKLAIASGQNANNLEEASATVNSMLNRSPNQFQLAV